MIDQTRDPLGKVCNICTFIVSESLVLIRNMLWYICMGMATPIAHLRSKVHDRAIEVLKHVSPPLRPPPPPPTSSLPSL